MRTILKHASREAAGDKRKYSMGVDLRTAAGWTTDDSP
jgi:hypothetical protein